MSVVPPKTDLVSTVGNPDGIRQQGKGILFDLITNITESARAFIVGQPVLFVLTTGLLVAMIHVILEIVTYWVARLGGRTLTLRFLRWLRLDVRHMDRAEKMFTRWGIGLVMFGRILPGVRTLVSVPAGMTRMNFGLFLGAAFGGAYFWNTLLVAAGYLLGFKVTLFGISIM